MQWLNCQTKNNYTTIVENNAGSKEKLDLNHYYDLFKKKL